MPSYKLYYFALRGRAEIIRYIFAAAGVEFEDIRIPLDEWSKHKPSMPFGQMPLLEVDGRRIGQSYAIARYLANEFNLSGKDKYEAAMADMYTGAAEDLFGPTVNVYFEENETVKAEGYKSYKEKVPAILSAFDEDLKKSSSGFLVGDRLTYADLALLSLIEFVEGTFKDKVKPVVARYENVQNHREKIQSLPAIAAWRSERPSDEY